MNVLFISVAFPPKRDPECIQTARFFKYLCKSETIDFTVLTSQEPTLYMPHDKAMESYDCGYSEKIELKIKESRLLNSLFHRLMPGSLFPDSKRSFFRGITKASIKQKPDLIYSRSFPISSTLAAFEMVRKYKVPWILHLSDPWAAYPLHNYSRTISKRHEEAEKMCVEMASSITLTSAKTVSLYQSIYPHLAHKFHYVPNVYDPEDFSPQDLDFSEKMKVVYTGGMIGSRNPSYFFKAFRRLDIATQKKFEIIFVGQADRSCQKLIKGFQESNPGIANYLGPVPFHQAREIQRSSHLLLLIDNPLGENEESIFFPSKILDYFTAQRRIVAITPKSSTTEEILSENHFVFTHDETDKLASLLSDASRKFDLKEASYFELKELPEYYSAAFQSSRLMEIFEQYVKKN